ncbi:MAG TPA: indole-3-glycerol phosphate synthase TrpC [Ferruginibacter sp.]|nr:indole-3-glycerol phosphate synthase TrpC [Ferruginibacter sp.]
MKNILEEIVAVKKREVEYKKYFADLDWYKFFSTDFDRKCISLKENLLKEKSTGIIAEFKRKSPSKGWFKKEDYSAPAIIMCYEQYGAAGVSVLTDKEFFGGDLPDLTVCRVVTELPILRKDFIIDEIQMLEAKAYGADAILLIAAILSPKRVEELATEAKKYGLEVLLELHRENELGHICNEVDMVGINNRNLQTFEVDIDHSIKLSKQLPGDKVKISESGIDDIETIKKLKDAGFQGFLIGEKFMKEPHPGTAFEQFVQKLKQP